MNQTKTIETLREALQASLDVQAFAKRVSTAKQDRQLAEMEVRLEKQTRTALALPIPQPDEQRVREAYLFYVNEEWRGLARLPLETVTEGVATLRKTRIDADDELVRVIREKDFAALAQADTGAEKETRESIEDQTHDLWLDALGASGLVKTYSTGETAEETIGHICTVLAQKQEDLTAERDSARAKIAELEATVDRLTTTIQNNPNT